MKDTEFTLPLSTVFYELESAIKLYRRLSQERIREAGYDITVNQLIVLIQLVKNPRMTQVELAKKIFKDFASVTRMIELLVNQKLVVRTQNKDDRRRNDLAPTAEGIVLVEALIPVISESRKIALENIPKELVSHTKDVLALLSENCLHGLEQINQNR